MGASCRRRAEAATAATAPGAGAMSPRPAPEIREAWLLAVQEEDAEAAGWCARLCEDLQGAEAFAASDGLDAFISVAMGQSVKGSGGLMVALAEALTMEMSEFKVAIFETLCAAAQWPSLKGRIAGCGVLGVITAKLLSPRPHPPSKALMARLCGMLATDSPEVRQLGDTRRATEFARLREQLIASGAVKALVAMLSAGAIEAASAAGAIEKLAEAASEEISAAGSSCGSTGDSMTAETKEREHPNESCHGTFDKTIQELISSATVPAMLKRLVAPDNNNDAEDELVALEAIASSLSKLMTSEGCTELIAPITEPTTVEDLCKVLGVASRGHHDLGGFSEQRKMVQHLLRCLHHLGTKHDCWPEFSKDLAEDLYGLLLFRCAAAAPFLQAILLKLPTSDSAAFLCYFERKRLHQALQELMNNSIDVGSSAAVIKILDSFQQCHRCGVIGSFPACGNCKLVAYCSKECQRSDWKSHKLQTIKNIG